jgi:hypothetical protein
MAKKPDLRQALKPAPQPPPQSAPKAPGDAPVRSRHYRPSRDGAENVTGYFPGPVKLQLMELSIERKRAVGHRVPIQDLLAEALNDLFAKYGKPEIVPISSKAKG